MIESRGSNATCRSRSGLIGRIALWLATAVVLAIPVFPYTVARLRGERCTHGQAPPTALSQATGKPGCPAGATPAPATAECDCDGAAASESARVPVAKSGVTTQPAPIDPARELVLNVENLQCPAVKGVGCGSMLAPVLAGINRVDGVAESFSNWAGTRLRVSLTPGADRNVVAGNVRALLAADGRQSSGLDGIEFAAALRTEDWHNAARLVDLSSYEFHTIAKRRIEAFADGEQLDAARREKLIGLLDPLWETCAEGLAPPGAAPGAYRQYWRARIARFVSTYADRARAILTPPQVERLRQQYQPHG